MMQYVKKLSLSLLTFSYFHIKTTEITKNEYYTLLDFFLEREKFWHEV